MKEKVASLSDGSANSMRDEVAGGALIKLPNLSLEKFAGDSSTFTVRSNWEFFKCFWFEKAHDQLQIWVRNLSRLDITSDSYGQLLNSIIFKLLPEDGS
ncbi:unnamed protein product [Larinioides sclopetarius]|uniref:Uncharacterized protein n=1 Tax=Larinioides sclopetarius TaxID=280406 RepID=A0AAV2AG61_9ARAC